MILLGQGLVIAEVCRADSPHREGKRVDTAARPADGPTKLYFLGEAPQLLFG